MTNEVRANYIPFCSSHPNCCYYEGCPADFGYNPITEQSWLVRCNKDCK